MDQFKDRFDENSYENGPSCLIVLFDTDIIDGTQIHIPEELLARIINLGQAYNLYYTSLIDVFEHLFFEKNHCEGLLDELFFLKEVTNDKLLHKYLDKILELAEGCIKRNCKLLVNGN